MCAAFVVLLFFFHSFLDVVVVAIYVYEYVCEERKKRAGERASQRICDDKVGD